MIYPISGDSAIQYWQTCSYAGQELNYVNNSMLFSDKDLTDKDFYLSQILSFADRNSIRAPVHILTGQESRRHKGKDFITHLAPADLPLKSIVELQGPVYIVSPELCFLLAAREKTFPELVKIGYVLFAKYVPAPREEFLQRTRVPLTTAAKLNEFINSAHNINGIVAAKKALKA